MSIEKMTLVQMTGNVTHFNEALKICSDDGNFHLEQSASSSKERISEKEVESHLKPIIEEGIDLKQLIDSPFIKMVFGRMPTESVKALDSNSDNLFVFVSLDEEGDFQWGIYFTPVTMASEVDGYFYSLYFEPVLLPGQEEELPSQIVSTNDNSASVRQKVDAKTKLPEKTTASKVGGEDNPYKPILERLIAISNACGIELQRTPVQEIRSVDRNRVVSFLEKFNDHLTQLSDAKKELTSTVEKREGAIRQLDRFQSLQANLDDLRALQYVTVRFGRIAKASLEALQQQEQLLYFLPTDSDQNNQWGVVLYPAGEETNIDGVLQNFSFDEITLSADAHGTPAEAKAALQERQAKAQEDLASLEEELKAFVNENLNNFIFLYSKIKILSAEFDAKAKSFKVDLPHRMVGLIPKLYVKANRKKELYSRIEKLEASKAHLSKMANLNVALDQIFACNYLQARFGRLPKDSYKKLEYFNDKMFIFVSFNEDSSYVWGAYFAPTGLEKEADDIFSSLYWEEIWIPDFVQGTPSDIQKEIDANLKSCRDEIAFINDVLRNILPTRGKRIAAVYGKAQFKKAATDIKKRVKIIEDKFFMTGFIPTRNQDNFQKEMARVESVEVKFKPHNSDKRLTPPTKIKNNRFFKPFEMFLNMYGLPSYTDIDPTPFLGITYSLLFGIMFGDLGQGLVLALVGWFLARKNGNDLGKIMMRIGCVSAVFGFAYGSVFGLEHLLDPFFINVLHLPGKPIEVMDPATINQLLIIALAIGVVLIILSMLINIYAGFKNRDLEKAVFSNNGIVGLLFYCAVLAGACILLLTGNNPFNVFYIIGLIVVPLLIMMFKHPIAMMVRGKKFKPEDGFGSFLIENFFEMFEVLLNYVTNTMSFLRVGGFIISHAGMMAVVMTLSEMFSGAGNIITLIIGNVFVMCLEGFIVGIQVLRLEFYEMFGRYYSGQGSEFVPLHIQSGVTNQK